METPFALWITGLPGSGKSTITAALVSRLQKRGVDPVVLESDQFRKYFTPHATHSEEERVLFYRGLVDVAAMMIDRGVPVIFDATGNRRTYRDPARLRFPKFAEVFVDCPLDVCVERDPKGIYRQGLSGRASTVPGLQSEYESPVHPEIHIQSNREEPDDAARKIVDFLVSSEWIPTRRLYRV